MYKKFLLILILMSVFSFSAECQNEWTIMVYMSGDNSFEQNSFNAVDAMERAGSLYNGYSDIEVVVLWDRIDGNYNSTDDWTGTRLYTITQNTNSGTIESTYNQWIVDEANMGDPETLETFIKYCEINHNAKNYALFFWGSGGEWFDNNLDKGVCLDQTSQNDVLTIKELENSIQNIRAYLKKPLKIVGFDASCMQTFELIYPMVYGAEYVIGSQQEIPDFLPYEQIIKSFQNNYYNTQQIIKNITGEYVKEKEGNSSFNVTLSAVNTTTFSSISSKLRKVNNYLIANMKDYMDLMVSARNEALKFKHKSTIDLYHFLGIIARDTKDKKFEKLIIEVLMNIYDSVESIDSTNENVISGDYPDLSRAYGVSIFMPQSMQYYNEDKYKDLLTSRIGNWDDMLDEYVLFNSTENGKNLVTSFKPEEIKILRARKTADDYEYKQVDKNDFLTGYNYLLGHYPYSPYEHDYYQIFLKFNVDDLIKIKDQINIKSASISHWNTWSWLKNRNIVGEVSSSFDGYVKNDQANKIDAYISPSIIKGDGLTPLCQKWIDGNNYGIVLGYDIIETDCGYIKTFNTDNVNLIVEYQYK